MSSLKGISLLLLLTSELLETTTVYANEERKVYNIKNTHPPGACGVSVYI